ncbi:MAG: biotin attachment protein [Candidatus Desulfofervidaceae bacterium]|nr:biotin attachment protein [Candidatus Desulfofervidaceae bacterium]
MGKISITGNDVKVYGKNMENIDKIIAEYKQNPFQIYPVLTPHTGIVSIKVKKGERVKGPQGKWQEKKGTLLYVICRQGNIKPIYAPIDGEVTDILEELNGKFVEAKTQLMSIKHKLTKEEVINKILERFLYIFRAPETAKYYLASDLNQKIEQKGMQTVVVMPGDEILIMSRMKRDVPLIYEGQPGIIYTLYFKPNTTVVSQGEPLLGICPPEQLTFISKLVKRINLEWEEV